MRRMFVALSIATVLLTALHAIDALPRQQIQPRDAHASSGQDKRPNPGPQAKVPDTASQQPNDNLQLQARLVSMTVTISDSLGRFVTGLQKKNFEVFDDGVKQEIAHFSDEDAPLTLGIVYDVSGSMGDLTSRSFKRFGDYSRLPIRRMSTSLSRSTLARSLSRISRPHPVKS